MRILHNDFDCKHKNFRNASESLEISKDGKRASLFDPLTLIVTAENKTECELFTKEIANSINQDKDE